MKINIVGLSKADVLLNLYNNATCRGPAFDNQPMMRVIASMSPPAKPEVAKKEMDERIERDDLYFDYVDLGPGPRPLKVHLSGFEFDSKSYDLYHGEGAAKAVISSLRNKVISEYGKEDKNSFAYLLSQIGAAIQNEEKNGTLNHDNNDERELNYSPKM